MKFKTKLAICYGLLLALTAPVFIYALSCHIAWVCVYAGIMVIISMITSFFVLREMNTRQRRLTRDIAHELRTPLACLLSSIEAILDGVFAPTQERLEACREEILRLAKLVDDLSILTDLEWDNLKLEKTDFDIASLLRKAAAEFEGEAERKGIRLVCEESPCVFHGDYARVKQALVNIVANAIKYTERGSVTLRNSGTEITVSDTGFGIDKESQPRIFERFYRTDASRERGTGGSGVGLTIALALIRAHGGGISVESDGKTGSVFRIRL